MTASAIEARARELAGGNHAHGAIPARFWREAIEEYLLSFGVSPARLYNALWLLKDSRYGNDAEFPTLPEVRVALEAARERHFSMGAKFYVRGHWDGLNCEANGFGGRLDSCEHVGRIYEPKVTDASELTPAEIAEVERLWAEKAEAI